MHVHTVGLLMKGRGQRKQKRREKSRKQLNSGLLAFTTGVSLYRVKVISVARDMEAPRRDTTVIVIPIGSS